MKGQPIVMRRIVKIGVFNSGKEESRGGFMVHGFADGSGELLIGDADPTDVGHGNVGRLSVDAERLDWLLQLATSPVASIPGIRLAVAL